MLLHSVYSTLEYQNYAQDVLNIMHPPVPKDVSST